MYTSIYYIIDNQLIEQIDLRKACTLYLSNDIKAKPCLMEKMHYKPL